MPTVPISEPETEDQTTSLMNQGKSRIPAWMGMPAADMQSKSMINESVRRFMEEQGRRNVTSIAKTPSPEGVETIAQRIFDAHAAFHPVDPGKAMPTPTDEEMMQYIGKAKIPAGGLRAIAGRVSDFVDSLNRNKRKREAEAN
jgi:hypothetical protein